MHRYCSTMDSDQLIQVNEDQLILALEQTLSPDQGPLDSSCRYLETLAQNEDSFAWLAAVLADLAAATAASAAPRSPAVRQQAAIQLKNLVRHKDGGRCRWLQMDPLHRQRVKSTLLAGLLGAGGTDCNAQSCHFAGEGLSQCIQAVAELELPQGTWPDLLPQLVALAIADAAAAAAAIVGSLKTLGYICETVNSSCLGPGQLNQILTAVVHGLRAGRGAEVSLWAARALSAALALAAANFARRPERNHIMEVRPVR